MAKFKLINTGNMIVCLLVLATLISGGILASTKVKANSSAVSQLSITVPSACALSSTIESGEEHEATILPGTYALNIGITNLKAVCNDSEGFAIYAVGDTDNEEGNNVLVGTRYGEEIVSSDDTTGEVSNWGMMLTKVTNPGGGDPDITYDPENLDINSDYLENYNIIPDELTKVAEYPAVTDRDLGVNMQVTYGVSIAQDQVADTYIGQVKYMLVHPASIEWVSSAITVNFILPENSNMTFSDGSKLNTVEYRNLCDLYDDGYDICHIAVIEGEYEQPTNYKGAWESEMTLDGDGPLPFTVAVENSESMLFVLEYMLNGGVLEPGDTVDVVAYDGYAVRYNGNGATAGDMSSVASRFTMVNNENGYEFDFPSDYTTLIAPNFYRSGYGFAGWSTSSSATVNGADTIYGPNATIAKTDLTFDSDNTDTLYAVWVQSTGDLQSFTCSSLSSGEVTALTDTRDGNVYTVGKLADGNCWMMENLRLDDSATLNATNTNNPVISRLSASSNAWCTDSDALCINQTKLNTNNTNGLLTATYGQYLGGVDSQWYGYGNYYNWYAATAGNGTYALSDGDAAGDICPAGWHLPSGTDTGEFYALNTAVNSGATDSTASAGLRAYPNNFVYSGYWYDSFAEGRSYVGDYWSRTASDSDYAYEFALYSDDSVIPGNGGPGKYHGLSIRCTQSGS